METVIGERNVTYILGVSYLTLGWFGLVRGRLETVIGKTNVTYILGVSYLTFSEIQLDFDWLNFDWSELIHD